MGRKPKDIFDLVKQRKKDINKRQATYDRRQAKIKGDDELLRRRMRDPIFKDTWKKVQRDKKYHYLTVNERLPDSVRKVLAEREKSNNPVFVDDPTEINIPRTVANLRKRAFIEASTNPLYHCPRCGECKTNLSEWFVSKVDTSTLPLDLMMHRIPRRKVLCRSCVEAFGWEINVQETSDKTLYSRIIKRYKIDAIDLSRKRAVINKTVQQFAEIVGWTADYQYQLEAGIVLSLNEAAMSDLVAAFGRCGIEVPMGIWGTVDRYVLDGTKIKELRFSQQLSLKAFSTRCRWSKSYQYKIENKRTTVGSEKLKLLLDAFKCRGEK